MIASMLITDTGNLKQTIEMRTAQHSVWEAHLQYKITENLLLVVPLFFLFIFRRFFIYFKEETS